MACPIIERITLDLIDAIKSIKTMNGYSHDVTVERPTRQGNIPKACLVLVNQMQPELLDRANLGWIAWRQPYAINCFVILQEDAIRDIDTRLNTMRSDVEKAVRVDRQRSLLAWDTVINEPLPFDDDDGAFSGITVNVDVLYDTHENDPYTGRA